jgi:hypothetical protein
MLEGLNISDFTGLTEQQAIEKFKRDVTDVV